MDSSLLPPPPPAFDEVLEEDTDTDNDDSRSPSSSAPWADRSGNAVTIAFLQRKEETEFGTGEDAMAVISGAEGMARNARKRRACNRRLEEALAEFEATQFAERIRFRSWAEEWCVRQEQNTRSVVERIRAAEIEAEDEEVARAVRPRI
jgi:hypothetical protein